MIDCGRGNEEDCIKLGGEITHKVFAKCFREGKNSVTRQEFIQHCKEKGLFNLNDLPQPFEMCEFPNEQWMDFDPEGRGYGILKDHIADCF